MTRPDGPLLETPIHEWIYESVNQFLSARIREDERIEYKSQFQTKEDNFLDTLVAMANGDGGFIFVGVSEHNSLPVKWPLLEPGKNHTLTAYKKAGSETSPLVRITAVPFTDPTGDGHQLVVVRVEAGDNPPYFAKGRGVKVRVGESEVHADPRMLAYLFARRGGFAEAVEGLRGHLLAFAGSPLNQQRLAYRLVIAPPVGSFSFPMNDQSTATISGAVSASALYLDTARGRDNGGLRFGKPDRRLSVTRTAHLAYDYLGELPDPAQMPDEPGGMGFPQLWPPIPMATLFRDTYACLSLAGQFYPALAGYEGRLYVGAAAVNLYDRRIEWTGTYGGERRDTPDHTDRLFGTTMMFSSAPPTTLTPRPCNS